MILSVDPGPVEQVCRLAYPAGVRWSPATFACCCRSRLFRAYFAGCTDNPREAMKRSYGAYRALYDVLPATFEECEPLLGNPLRAARVTAMVYPTTPFNAPRAVDAWPNLRTPLGYATGSGCLRCACQPATARMVCRRPN
jgi:hypothetical protein